MICQITLTGGGPGDGSLICLNTELDTALQQKEVNGGFFWMLLYCYGRGKACIYCEEHPRDTADELPPKKLRLSHSDVQVIDLTSNSKTIDFKEKK